MIISMVNYRIIRYDKLYDNQDNQVDTGMVQSIVRTGSSVLYNPAIGGQGQPGYICLVGHKSYLSYGLASASGTPSYPGLVNSPHLSWGKQSLLAITELFGYIGPMVH